jgi:hypothetical protein
MKSVSSTNVSETSSGNYKTLKTASNNSIAEIFRSHDETFNRTFIKANCSNSKLIIPLPTGAEVTSTTICKFGITADSIPVIMQDSKISIVDAPLKGLPDLQSEITKSDSFVVEKHETEMPSFPITTIVDSVSTRQSRDPSYLHRIYKRKQKFKYKARLEKHKAKLRQFYRSDLKFESASSSSSSSEEEEWLTDGKKTSDTSSLDSARWSEMWKFRDRA